MLEKYFSLENFIKKEAQYKKVSPVDQEAWTNFTRAATDLENVLAKSNTLHELIFGDIEYHMKLLAIQLDRLDRVYEWRKKKESRRENMLDQMPKKPIQDI